MSAYVASAFAALPLGLAFGMALAFVRVSGVDFRQWFKDPAQPSELADDTWVGLLRKATSIYAFGIAATVFFAWFAVWLPELLQVASTQARPATQWLSGALWLIVNPKFVGSVAGYVVAQALAETAWRAGLTILPEPAPITRLLAPVIPSAPMVGLAAASKPRRRLVLFCDGTWNWPDPTRATNVVRLLRSVVAEAEGIRQTCYYHQGVGTGNVLDRVLGGGAGVGISNSVKACYGFLADNYQDGDEILLFGFSRGAFVARSIAGLVGTVGILRKSEMRNFAEIWDWFTDGPKTRKKERLDEIAGQRWQHVPIQCIGVWDTVGALGIPGSRLCARSFAFHDTELGPHVRYAFQALALDEQRGSFQAAVWVPPELSIAGQVVEQVWFPGVHSNIGGGYPRRGLSDTTLIWMASRLLAQDLLVLDEDFIRSTLDPDEHYASGKLEESRTLAWSLFGSALPRPVGLISPTEWVHASAWDRETAALHVPKNDLYRRKARQAWLAVKQTEGLRVELDPKEIDLRKPQGAPVEPSKPPYVPRKLGFCDRLMQQIGGSG